VSGSGKHAILYVGSQLTSDYNDIFVLGGANVGNKGEGVAYASLADWRARTGQDAHSLSADPLFANAAAGDFHLRSNGGRYDPARGFPASDPAAWVIDVVTSPCIDAGDPATPTGWEPPPNGNRVNLGAYGGTSEASKTDLTPPTVIGYAVTDDTGIGGDAITTDTTPVLTFTFNETVMGQNADVVVSGPDAQAVTPDSIAGWGTTVLTVTFATPLTAQGQYNVTLRGTTTIRDTAGNALNGGADEVRHFTLDTTPPQLADGGLSPADNAINVAVDAPLVITFQEPIQKGAGAIVVKKSSDQSTIETIDVSDPAVTVNGTSVTILRTKTLAEVTGYYVEVAAGAFEDLAGNDFAGLTESTAWDFTTAGLLVTSVTPTATGFTASFNQPVDASLLNLYDGSAHTLGDPDVMLVGSATGPVRGSLVLSDDQRQITLIRTGGLLPADTYTVTLRGADNGFVDQAGIVLDGNGDGMGGDDYTTTFTSDAVPANAVVVSLPDFTRGYGQPVNLPANVPTAGLPLSLSDGSTVSRVTLTLAYDRTLLNLLSFTLDSGVAARGATAAFTVPSSGPAVLEITAPAGVSLGAAAGRLTVGAFIAQVPDAAAYGAKHVLDLADLHVYDLSAPQRVELPAVDDDAIHVAALFGDTNGDGRYNSPDVTLVRRIIGQMQTGLPAYQLADPMLIADLTLNDRLQSADTTSLRRVIGQVPVANVPPLPGNWAPTTIFGLDPRVYIPRDLAGVPGGTVTVPVKLEVTEPAGLTLGGFDLVLDYDPSCLTVTAAQLGDLADGTDLSGTWTQPAPGRLVFSADAFRGTTQYALETVGDLVTVTFVVAPATAAGATVINLRTSWGSTTTALFDNDLRPLVLTPAPTDAPTDAVDGLLAIGGWQNPRHPCDVNDDGYITPVDVLLLINDINAHGPRELTAPPTPTPPPFLDPTGDGWIGPIDVLRVINCINEHGPGPVLSASGGEGEYDSPIHRDVETIAVRSHVVGSGSDTGGSILASTGPSRDRQAVWPAALQSASRAVSKVTPPRMTLLNDGLETSELKEAISAIAGEVAQAWDSQLQG
jgi:methionine-rich copper-binding protein CopC